VSSLRNLSISLCRKEAVSASLSAKFLFSAWSFSSWFWNGYRDTVSVDTGFLARTCWKNGDVWLNQNDLTSACAQLICNEGLRENMSRNARRNVEQNYKWEYCVDKYRSEFSALIRKDLPDYPTCKNGPDKVTVRINRKQQTLTLPEALNRAETFGVTFQNLHVGFVSDPRPKGTGWTRFICRDNITNLPKYKFNMRRSLETFENRLSMHFPQLTNALRQP